MNKKSNAMYELAKIHGYIIDIQDICDRFNNDYDLIISDRLPYNALLMLFVQIGECCIKIRDKSNEFYLESKMPLRQIISMRNHITHGYVDIDKDIFIDTIKVDIPRLKIDIENIVIDDVLENPTCLYKLEYDELEEEVNHVDFELEP